jgi:heptosyltransferase-2
MTGKTMDSLLLKTDCRHFRGDVPCKPHKEFGVHCVEADGTDCKYYDRSQYRILIIKLGALGDVIRTTPLLNALKKKNPDARITWLTLSPEILPDVVDDPMELNLRNIVTLRSMHFNILYNLDKDREACALASQISAVEKKGFTLRDGLPSPIDADANHKFQTGVFDDISKANTKSYQEEIFEIAGLKFSGEKYLLDNFASHGYRWNVRGKKKVVGLNTGCGDRWTSRLWADKNWVDLAKNLKKQGFQVILLGGKQEHEKNRKLARLSGAKYPGHFPLHQFINLVDQCDLVVTAVTMAMHITIGLGKRMVLFNNIFNRHEFDLYGLGVILEPSRPCQCFYHPVCTNKEYQCMEYLSVQQVSEACKKMLA